jgi:hypothetical protein
MSKKLTTEQCIQKSIKKHGFGRYDYSKVVYITNDTKIKIICLVCHNIFEQRPSDHWRGRGCDFCGGSKKDEKHFFLKANKKHNFKFSYKNSKYINNKIKIEIKCLKHDNIFYQSPTAHLKGSGCNICISKSTEEFIKEAQTIHLGKNYIYDEVVYSGAHNKVKIICPHHGPFYQTPSNHLTQSSCPQCSHGNISKSEILWLESLNIPVECRQTYIVINGRKFKVDAYDDKTNTIYEFNGDYWHGNPKKYSYDTFHKLKKMKMGELYDYTIERENIIKNAGYNLVVIWESEWKKKSKKPSRIAREYNKSNLTLPYLEFLHK